MVSSSQSLKMQTCEWTQKRLIRTDSQCKYGSLYLPMHIVTFHYISQLWDIYFFLPWRKHQACPSEHIRIPRTQHPAAHRCTRRGHRSHPKWRKMVYTSLTKLKSHTRAIFIHFLLYFCLNIELHTWQESLPPSRNPAQNMDSVIMPG